jgi:hypothetical protein
MVRALVLGGVLVTATAAAILMHDGAGPARPAGESGRPVLQVRPERIDLGEVPLGQWVDAHFTLTNAGDGRLRFARAPYVEAVAGC